MQIAVSCSACGTTGRVANALAGTTVTCPNCHGDITIPDIGAGRETDLRGDNDQPPARPEPTPEAWDPDESPRPRRRPVVREPEVRRRDPALVLGICIFLVLAVVGCGVAIWAIVAWTPQSDNMTGGSGDVQVIPAPTPRPPKGELVAVWRLDEGEGDTAADELGRNRAKLVGPRWTQGLVRQALEFDGRSAYCDLGDHPSLNFEAGQDIAVSVSFKTDDSEGPIVTFRNSQDAGAVISLAVEEGRLVGIIREDGGELRGPALIRGEQVNDGHWHWALLVRDASADRIELYLDGCSQGMTLARANGAAGSVITDLRTLGSDRYRALKGQGTQDRLFLRGSIDLVVISLTGAEPGQ